MLEGLFDDFDGVISSRAKLGTIRPKFETVREHAEAFELEIFSFIRRGMSVSELATELHVSVKTIETHQMRMKDKLALHSAAELRQKAREWLAKSAVNRIREDPESE